MRVSRDRLRKLERTVALGPSNESIRVIYIAPDAEETGRTDDGEWVFRSETEIPAEWTDGPGLNIIMNR